MFERPVYTALVIVHVLAGIALGFYVYSPDAHDSSTYTFLAKAVIVPLIVITGFAIYMFYRVRKIMATKASA